MLPEGTLASSVSPTTYNIGDIAPRQNLLEDFELGGVALNDSSQGRYTQRWKGWYDSGNIYLNNEADATSILVNSGLSNVLEVSITFDGSMAPVIAYLVGTTTNLYWYDAIIPGYTTLSYSGCTSPMLCYDDKRESETTNSDIMLFYIRNGGIYYRQQRDRFTIEYTLIASVPSGRIMNVGMNLENRLQLTYKKDIGTIISTNTIKAELHPKNTSNLDTSTSIASAYLNFTNCAQVLPSCQEEILADNPYAYYKLGEISGTSAIDYSGNNRHGGYENFSATSVTGLLASDPTSKATYFSGDTTSYSAPNINTGFNTHFTSGLTIEVTFKVDANINTSISRDYTIVAQRRYYAGTWTEHPFGIRYNNITSEVSVALSKGDDYNSDNIFTFLIAKDTVYNLIFVYRPSASCELWINGYLIESKTINFAINASSLLWRIGGSDEYPGEPSGQYRTRFHGTIDEVVFYDYPLSSERIKSHYKCQLLSSVGEFCNNFGEDTWFGKNGTVWSVNGFINTNGETSIESYFSVEQKDSINFEVELRIGEYSEPGVPVPPVDTPQPGEEPIIVLPTPTIDWIKVYSNYSASSGDRIWPITTSGPIRLSLPLNPSIGDEIWFRHDDSWWTNMVTIVPGSVKVGGTTYPVLPGNVELDYVGGSIRCTYIDANFGWNVQQGSWEGLYL
jgi:hypothetical protein